MRIIKITAFTLLLLLLSGAILGYFYFEKKITPPDNQLRVSNGEDTLKIKWTANNDSEISALLLPVLLEGIPDTFYMQFDLGSHSTLFYSRTLESLKDQNIFSSGLNEKRAFNFTLGNVAVSTNDVRTLDYGAKIDLNSSAVNIIGTLGADILEHKVVAFDFKHHTIHFLNTFPEEVKKESILPFQFRERKVLLPAKVSGEETLLYYDSGSSAFELITNHEQWGKLATSGAVEQTYKANSLGNPLKVHNIASRGSITFGNEVIPLNYVTYIEGTSMVQNLLMYFSGMRGMIGNKLFMDRILILDAANEKMAVL